MSQIAKALLYQRLSEDVRKLLSCVDGVYDNSPITNKLPKVMIFYCNMFCARSKLGALYNGNTGFVVFPNSTSKDGISC